MIRTVVTATLVCLASWAGLAFGAGFVGLQRTISIGPWTLFEHPFAVVLSTGLAFATTVALTGGRAAAATPWALVVAVLLGDVIGAVLIAPAAIGELEVRDAPVVFVVLATLGLQPVAAALGAWIASGRPAS